MFVDRQAIAVTTDGSGNFTGYTAVVRGQVVQIYYVPDGSVPLDTNTDVVFTEEDSTLPIVTKANIGTSAFSLAPRQPTHAVADGSALLYAAGGAAVADEVVVAGSRIKLVVAQGGAAKKGTFYVYVA